ncbi:hypothetical protein CK203_081392 [Vitis vinifera]|uniref:Uncharacterized protein n=1 Tax=Vitis vinifera TaxID=29760 RepID=A0A438DG42_VITVI|nr:hypothetical protein CK203_081392 [Vitis vinifera]
MDLNLKLGEKSTKIPVDRGRYQCLVGKLIYLSHTRPNITFAVSNVSQLGGERIAFEGGVVSCISFWTGYCGISKALLGEDYSLKELKKEVLKPSLMPIGLVQLKIEGLPPAIAHLFRELGYMEEQEANSCLS